VPYTRLHAVLEQIKLDTLSNRSFQANFVLISKLISGELNAPDPLTKVNFKVLRRNLCKFFPFHIPM